MMPGYINHEGEVVQDITDHHSTVVTHRRSTRQRHLSSGQDENIASNYFAAQYGGQQRQAEVGILFLILWGCTLHFTLYTYYSLFAEEQQDREQAGEWPQQPQKQHGDGWDGWLQQPEC